MKEFYNELKERLKVLENQKSTTITDGRISELLLVIVRVQQILLENIGKSEEKFEKHQLKHAFYDGMLYGKNELPVVNEFDFTGKPELTAFDVWYEGQHK